MWLKYEDYEDIENMGEGASTDALMKKYETYSGWNISERDRYNGSIWQWDKDINNGYPYLAFLTLEPGTQFYPYLITDIASYNEVMSMYAESDVYIKLLTDLHTEELATDSSNPNKLMIVENFKAHLLGENHTITVESSQAPLFKILEGEIYNLNIVNNTNYPKSDVLNMLTENFVSNDTTKGGNK